MVLFVVFYIEFGGSIVNNFEEGSVEYIFIVNGNIIFY